MKKTSLLFSLFSILLITSCKNDEDDLIIWDFANMGLDISVVDQVTGDNLLDPNVEGNILDNEITVDYDGKTYDIFNLDNPMEYPSYDESGPRSRFNMPINLGLRFIKGYFTYDQDSKEHGYKDWHHLFFGEFNTQGDLHQENLIINWGDGTSNKIVFDCYINWKSKKDPEVHHEVWVDGKKIDGTRFTITKSRK